MRLENIIIKYWTKLIIICLLISNTYLFLNRTIPIKSVIIQVQPKPSISKPNAFIITENCKSIRYNFTKENIQRVFPNFFNIICYLSIPLNDPRIHTSNTMLWKKLSSNLLTFIELWTYEIPKYSKDNELSWTFIFEDDVNFNSPSKFYLRNYIASLEELIYNPEVQITDGFIYLGICRPSFLKNTEPFIARNTSDNLISRRGYGSCLHASGITAKRSKLFWTEISSYRPNSPDSSLDFQLREYSIRSKTYFYTLGANFDFHPLEAQSGIAYQDRNRF